MYPNQEPGTQLGELQQLFKVPPASPRPPMEEEPTDPPSFRIREPWEQPALMAEPDDDDPDDDFDDDDYYEDEDDYEDDYEDLPRRGRSVTRDRSAAELGSYESRQAALGRKNRRAPKRRRGALRTMLPLLLLVAMAVTAVKFLGPAPTQLPIQHDQTPPSTTTKTPAQSAAGTSSLASFPSYPGQQNRDGGQLAINSLAVANGLRVAVGTADGYPAIWRQGSGSSWSLTATGASGPLARPGDQTLVTVADGPAGWLAVGNVVSGAQQHPIVVTSANGQTWQAADGSPAFSGAGLYTYGATAGRIDYVVVGEQVTGNTATAAAWWSAGLGAWNRGVADGASEPSEMFAVTVTPDRFISAGADGSKPAIWTSPNGQIWTAMPMALPAGATKAALREVADNGQQVVATGNAETSAGTVAFAEISGDDGATWREVPLPAPGPETAVDALAASNHGFVASGRSGQSNALSTVVWTSADGMNWTLTGTVPAPAGSTVRVISGLAMTGNTVTGIGVATTKTGASPLLYTAPAP
jgi:hypothetical protein